MTIRTPTSLVIDFNTDLTTEIASNRFTTHRLISNSLQLPVGSYSVGSIDLLDTSGTVILGTAGIGVISSDSVIDVTIGANDSISTKLFAYDGAVAPISISTTSTTPITVEYVIGTNLPVVPTAPAITSVEPGDGLAIVTFIAPTDDGGSPITSYTVTSSTGGYFATGTESPITVTGLTNDVSYTFTVIATNAVGDSVASNVSEPVTPYAVVLTAPSAPTIYDISMANNEVTIYFNVPDSDGGSPITGYEVVSTPDGISNTGTDSPITVSGLTYGTEYTFEVFAINAIGTSLPSNVSDPETPIGFPDAPVITDATINNTTATITFTTPNTNGSTITEYIVITNPTNDVTHGNASPIDVTGLQPGNDYTFTVLAVTVNGNGAQSTPSATLTATAAP